MLRWVVNFVVTYVSSKIERLVTSLWLSSNSRRYVYLEENAEKLTIRSISRDQNSAQSKYIKMGNKSFDSAEKLRYLPTNLTNQNFILEASKSKLKSEIRRTTRC
jgi:hypothetical protein